MFHQTFSLLDIPKILVLILLECVLSADNALIIATIIKPLPLEKRSKALWTGLSSAIILRLAAIFFIAYLIHFFWIQILGAIYLLYLAVAYRIKSFTGRQKTAKTSSVPPFWKVVLQLECVDFIFAFDSIIAALGLIGISISPETRIPPKLWIIYLGGIIGLILMRFAAKIFSTFMDKFHNLEKASHYLIGWVAIKLGLEALYTHLSPVKGSTVEFWIEVVFWVGLSLIIAFGFFTKKRK